MILRHATPHDLPAMIALGALMHQESNFRDLAYDPDALIEDASFMLARPEHYYLAVAEDGDELIGMFCGFITNAFFSRDLIAFDMLLFVRSDARGGSAAARLIRAFEAWAWDNGAKEIRPGVSTGVHPERTAALYQRLGFEQIGYILRKTKTRH